MEQWYLVIEKATGKLVSSGTTIPEIKDCNPDYEFKPVSGPPPDDKDWDATLKDFVAPPLPPIPQIYFDFINDTDIKALPKAVQDKVKAVFIKILNIQL